MTDIISTRHFHLPIQQIRQNNIFTFNLERKLEVWYFIHYLFYLWHFSSHTFRWKISFLAFAYFDKFSYIYHLYTCVPATEKENPALYTIVFVSLDGAGRSYLAFWFIISLMTTGVSLFTKKYFRVKPIMPCIFFFYSLITQNEASFWTTNRHPIFSSWFWTVPLFIPIKLISIFRSIDLSLLY